MCQSKAQGGKRCAGREARDAAARSEAQRTRTAPARGTTSECTEPVEPAVEDGFDAIQKQTLKEYVEAYTNRVSQIPRMSPPKPDLTGMDGLQEMAVTDAYNAERLLSTDKTRIPGPITESEWRGATYQAAAERRALTVALPEAVGVDLAAWANEAPRAVPQIETTPISARDYVRIVLRSDAAGGPDPILGPA